MYVLLCTCSSSLEQFPGVMHISILMKSQTVLLMTCSFHVHSAEYEQPLGQLVFTPGLLELQHHACMNEIRCALRDSALTTADKSSSTKATSRVVQDVNITAMRMLNAILCS